MPYDLLTEVEQKLDFPYSIKFSHLEWDMILKEYIIIYEKTLICFSGIAGNILRTTIAFDE